MSKHTAGKWRVNGTVIYSELDGNAVASIPENYSMRGAEEMKANANLLALSPELFDVVSQLDLAAKESKNIISFAVKSLSILKQARAAIAKETGGE